MYVGALKLELQILESHSLKEKRMLLRRIKDRVRARLSQTIVEVGANDKWQLAEIGLACAAGDRQHLGKLLDDVCRCVSDVEGVTLLGVAREITLFAGQARELRAQAAVDDWVPESWRQALESEAQPGDVRDSEEKAR